VSLAVSFRLTVFSKARVQGHAAIDIQSDAVDIVGGVPITVILDNARYQRCELVQALARQLGIRLLFLPSYSPNLNLIERLWRFVRKQSLNSTWFDSFEQFQAAIDDCLDKMSTDHKQEAATLFVHQFQRFEDVPILAA
jgi:hypothetical protein